MVRLEVGLIHDGKDYGHCLYSKERHHWRSPPNFPFSLEALLFFSSYIRMTAVRSSAVSIA